MSILGIKSIPLMKKTNRAWKTVPGLYFVNRKRNADNLIRYISSHQYAAIINLGRIDINFSRSLSPVFNDTSTIRAISTPGALRKTLGEFLPGQTARDHWHKSRGFGGANKMRHNDPACVIEHYEDIQDHIEGTEYRIVTVGNCIVQASQKGERRTLRNERNNFDYTWIGVRGIGKDGFIPFIKEAIGQIPLGGQTVLGWDVLHDGDRPWIIEVNTSPGVNEATAHRIITAIKRTM